MRWAVEVDASSVVYFPMTLHIYGRGSARNRILNAFLRTAREQQHTDE